jgi:hypothetical protein
MPAVGRYQAMNTIGLNLDRRWFFALAMTIFAMHELHELAHTWTGRLLCGSWPERDFNRWALTGNCSTWIPSLMGPIFSYVVLYAGAWLAVRGRESLGALGLALLFGANPFARLFTAAMGGGDEMILARAWTGTAEKTMALRMAVLAAVALITIPALIAAWRALAGTRRRTATFATLLFSGIFFTGIVYMLVLNRVLAAGVLAEPVILGEPLLVFATTVITLALWMLSWRWLGGGNARPEERGLPARARETATSS